MDEARGEEATQCGQQQECILSGEVYLRHRPEKQAFQNICLLDFPDLGILYHKQTMAYNLRRTGVQACKKLLY